MRRFSIPVTVVAVVLAFTTSANAACWSGAPSTSEHYDFVGILSQDSSAKQYLVDDRGMHADLGLILYGTVSGKPVAVIPIWSGGSMGISDVLVYELKNPWIEPLLLAKMHTPSLAGASFADGAVHLFTVDPLPGEHRANATRFQDSAYVIEGGDGGDHLSETSMVLTTHNDCPLFPRAEPHP